jgi:high-affinity nickel permease
VSYLLAAVVLFLLAFPTINLYISLIRLFWEVCREIPREANQEQHTASKGSRSRSNASGRQG